MKMNGEIDVQLCAFFTSAPDWSEWSTARADRFVPGQKGLSVHWVTGWVGPKLIWTRQQKEEKSLHYPAGNRTPDVQLVANCYCQGWGIVTRLRGG